MRSSFICYMLSEFHRQLQPFVNFPTFQHRWPTSSPRSVSLSPSISSLIVIDVLRDLSEKKRELLALKMRIWVSIYRTARIITLWSVTDRDIRLCLFPFNDLNQIMVWVADEEAIRAWDEDGFLNIQAMLFHPYPCCLGILDL